MKLAPALLPWGFKVVVLHTQGRSCIGRWFICEITKQLNGIPNIPAHFCYSVDPVDHGIVSRKRFSVIRLGKTIDGQPEKSDTGELVVKILCGVSKVCRGEIAFSNPD